MSFPFPMPQYPGQRQYESFRGGIDQIPQLIAAIMQMIKEQKQKAEAEEAGRGFFTPEEPTNFLSSPMGPIPTGQSGAPTGFVGQPNFQAMIQALMSMNPQLKEMAGGALGGLGMIQKLTPEQKVLEGETGEFLSYDPRNPRGIQTIRPAPTKPTLPPPSITPYQTESLKLQREGLDLRKDQARQGVGLTPGQAVTDKRAKEELVRKLKKDLATEELELTHLAGGIYKGTRLDLEDPAIKSWSVSMQETIKKRMADIADDITRLEREFGIKTSTKKLNVISPKTNDPLGIR